MSDVETWWRELTTAALIGTSRRPVPALPDLGFMARTDAPAEELALDSAAIGAAVRHAGRVAEIRSAPELAEPDELRLAPDRANQLLDLLVDQPPAGARLRPQLIDHWLRVAGEAGCRLPHRLLPRILTLATEHDELRMPTVRTLDARGRWLAHLNPLWAWVDTLVADAEEGLDVARLVRDWAELPSAERAAALSSYRLVDPVAARELLLTTWSVDGAKYRQTSIAALANALGPEDEDLLESALDDRAGAVREVALRLLDGLPRSQRARRMAARLRPLIHTTGLLKRGLDAELPDDPDAAGVRDGLGKSPGRRSQRGWWLEQLAAAAPLPVWTEVSGVGAAATAQRLDNEDALAGIRRATLARRDAEWAIALVAKRWDASLLSVIPRVERDRIASDRLSKQLKPTELIELAGSLPGPWSSQVSQGIVRALSRQEDSSFALSVLATQLATNLHPDTIGTLTTWLNSTEHPGGVETRLRNIIQFQSVKSSITEAFR